MSLIDDDEYLYHIQDVKEKLEKVKEDLTALYPIAYNYCIYLELSPISWQEVEDFFEEQVRKIQRQRCNSICEILSRDINLVWNSEAEKLKDIMLSDDISLYEFCTDKDIVAKHMSFQELLHLYRHTNDKDERFLGAIPTQVL
ncbi:hypothetical protein TKK_0003802 [Trichogramma kaykai]